MGDRALIQFKDSTGAVSPVVYLHWGGSRVESLLTRLRKLMDGRNDLNYAAARFVGICHMSDPDHNLSLGIWNQSTELTKADTHHDAGCFVVNCATWEVECFGGYGFDPGGEWDDRTPESIRITDRGIEVIFEIFGEREDLEIIS